MPCLLLHKPPCRETCVIYFAGSPSCEYQFPLWLNVPLGTNCINTLSLVICGMGIIMALGGINRSILYSFSFCSSNPKIWCFNERSWSSWIGRLAWRGTGVSGGHAGEIFLGKDTTSKNKAQRQSPGWCFWSVEDEHVWYFFFCFGFGILWERR